MKKVLLTIAAIAMFASAASADVIWDQSATHDVDQFMNSISAGMWGTVIIYSASDINVTVPATITNITTYYTNTGQWVAGSYPAVVDVYAKTGATPVTGADDPLNGLAVTIDLVDVGGMFEVRATGLNIPVTAGEYWVVLTPEIADGPSFREFQWAAAAPWGDDSCNIEFGGWLPPAWAPSGGLDGAMKIEADVTVATDESTWGQFKAIYR